MDVTAALGLGALVGLGVAMPLGAIGVLLLQTGVRRGFRVAAAGGLGVATVDLVYAVVAVLAGAAVAGALAGHERPVRVASALVLGAVAATGVLRWWRTRDRAAATSPAAGPDAVDPDAAPPDGGSPARAFAGFVALTAINPLTVVYFAAVVAGLADRLTSPGDRLAFVVGIGGASAAWQVGLGAVGAALGARVGPRARSALTLAGHGVVGALAVALALR
ncbi:LysE family transporter [Actinotalea fermentans]|uniref:Lysine transporter LysE n=1 Tax=Actinotalea fermentans TaxID=43671 RepID=A0A511Z0U3_9CELL|nr:LysE family transporter [Actinotalea fermentans]GEN81053.1 hypothetical protein AFE02nite_27870 [Actinotalea fermentans]